MNHEVLTLGMLLPTETKELVAVFKEAMACPRAAISAAPTEALLLWTWPAYATIGAMNG